MMDEMISRFAVQLGEAIEIGEKAWISPADNLLHKIFISGLYGSGIRANFVSSFSRDTSRLPYYRERLS